MQVVSKVLKPVSDVQLNADETKILKWLKTADWQPQNDARPPIPYKARVPEFYSGVRMYKLQGSAHTAGGALGALELFIKKLEYQGVLTKQDLYPVSVIGAVRYLSLKKADLDSLGVGKNEEDED
jgi:hypothetical protein